MRDDPIRGNGIVKVHERFAEIENNDRGVHKN